MSAINEKFETWLRQKLRELETDETIFGDYILGILDSDETQEEKADALQGILGDAITEDPGEIIDSILNKWLECQPKEEKDCKVPIDVNEQLAKLLEQQKLQAPVKVHEMTEEERRIKEQILAQYSQTEVSDEDAYDDDGADGGHEKAGASGIERNTNVEDVKFLQKERREQARLDSAAKKQKDKDDREKQKQLREEKKEKRKTVKGERRR